MFYFIFLIAVIGVILAVITSKKNPKTSSLAETYQRHEKLCSAAERSFLGVLQQACDDDIVVFSKVRVADIIGVKATKNRTLWKKSFNKICSKHFDFVLCDKNDLAILCAIELDDKSHKKTNRQQRDFFKDELSKAVQLPLVRFPVKRSYEVVTVRSSIEVAIKLKKGPIKGPECFDAVSAA